MVYRANKSNGTYSKIATIKNKNTTYYKNSNLSSNKKYYYKVRAYKKNGSKTYYGSYSNVLSVSTTSKSKPYMTAYKTFLDKNKYLNGKKVEYFFTHDINNDGICEINCYNNQGVCTKNCISGDDKMQIIAPRSYGEYSYSVKNTTKKVIRYNISYAEDNVYNINLLYRVKRNGLYITGWKKASEIKFNEMNLPSGKTDNYVLEWYWKDSENDTSIGELDAATYTITINVTAKGE